MKINEVQEKCQFFEDKISTIQYFFLIDKISGDEFDCFLESGFRKFGYFFFRYSCPACKLCIPLRVIVNDFKMTNSQKKVLKKNENLKFSKTSLKYKDEHFELYKRYNYSRFGKIDEDINEYANSFCCSPVNSFITEIYCENKLMGAGFIDEGSISLSSVYFFYDPDYKKKSPGIFSIIKELELAKSMDKKYYYLGFYVKGKKFSDYKFQFKPNQIYDITNDVWS